MKNSAKNKKRSKLGRKEGDEYEGGGNGGDHEDADGRK
jgi:hypothetical protein